MAIKSSFGRRQL